LRPPTRPLFASSGDELGQQFTILSEETAELTKQYLMDAVKPAISSI